MTQPASKRHRANAEMTPRRDVGARSSKHAATAPRIAAAACGAGLARPSQAAANSAQSEASASAKVPGWKRRLDISCIMMSLPLILPLVLVLVLWIKLVSRGPALLRQQRIGRDGKPFVLYKLRSMKLDSDPGAQASYVRSLVMSDRPMVKMDLVCDSRLIAGGCLMRAAGLDELPQLFNVLRGEMSLVGPRPCLPGEDAFFSQAERERFHAIPGLTGMWQVSGKNRATFREMNRMDIHYVRNASLMMDLHIMMRTPAALLFQMCLAFQQKRKRGLAVQDRGTEAGHGCHSPSQRQLQ